MISLGPSKGVCALARGSGEGVNESREGEMATEVALVASAGDKKSTLGDPGDEKEDAYAAELDSGGPAGVLDAGTPSKSNSGFSSADAKDAGDDGTDDGG